MMTRSVARSHPQRLLFASRLLLLAAVVILLHTIVVHAFLAGSALSDMPSQSSLVAGYQLADDTYAPVECSLPSALQTQPDLPVGVIPHAVVPGTTAVNPSRVVYRLSCRAPIIAARGAQRQAMLQRFIL